MPASTALGTDLQLLLQMELPESIMFSLELVFPSSKGIKMKSQRFRLILKEIRSLPLAVINHAECGL